MAGKSSKVFRCAIYTRKSTEHGLELEFNSLDAQREACEAYIKSQTHEGWHALVKRYDDPAFSGGNLERPAVQRLLKDIEAGLIDVVVVYKIDRLTRSLADFAKLVEVFDARSVSFVAVTQQFNTTTSMGRLTLNVLLSFAQFERELSSERVRDKIAASRKKGKWTGGSVPLGYDSKEKKLVVNPTEAKTVRLLFERYLVHKSLLKLTEELRNKGIVTKKRAITGKVVGSIPFTYGPLAYLLKNRTYLGETGHNGSWFPGEHKPIIDRATFEKAQELLKSNSVARTGRQQKTSALLTGLLFDDRGNRMSPSFTVKGGIRYPFYISSAIRNGHKPQVGSVRRVSGIEIEAAVLNALRSNIPNDQEAEMALTPRSLIERYVARIVITPTSIVTTLKVSGNANSVPIELPWHARAKRDFAQLEYDGAHNGNRTPNPQLVQAIVRAHVWLNILSSGTHESIESFAIGISIHPKVVRAKIRLAFLPPKMTRAVLTGEQPAALTLAELNRGVSLVWNNIKWG